MVAVVTNAIALTRPRVAAPRAARRRVTTAAASPNTSVSSAPSSVSNLMPRDRSTTQEIAQVAAKKASVAVPAKGSEPAAAAPEGRGMPEGPPSAASDFGAGGREAAGGGTGAAAAGGGAGALEAAAAL